MAAIFIILGVGLLLTTEALDGIDAGVAIFILGVGLLVAGLLGGGVEFWSIKIPRIPKRWERIAVCVLGVLLLLAGLWVEFGDNADDKKNGPKVTINGTPPPSSTLVGKLDLLHHAEDFRDRYTDYSITARADPTPEFVAEIDV